MCKLHFYYKPLALYNNSTIYLMMIYNYKNTWTRSTYFWLLTFFLPCNTFVTDKFSLKSLKNDPNQRKLPSHGKDKALNRPQAIKVLKIAWSGINPIIHLVMKISKRFLLCFTIMHYIIVHFYGRSTTYSLFRTYSHN